MSVDFLKPYELSIWEDELVEDIFQDEPISYYKENKIAIIASNDLKGPNTAYNIVLKKNKNGEKTLSFSIKYRYFDYQTQTIIENPFASYLINERKVKLKFGEDWYDFIIKECTESSEDYEWSYTAEDAFVLELSKNGYNIELNQELNNNQGSAVELALRTLEDTNWDVISIDLKPPIINEPLYMGYLDQDVSVHNMDDDNLVDLQERITIFVFYSYIANKNGHFLQFIINNPEEFEIDDNNNIIATNYRFDEEMVYGYKDNIGPFIAYASDPTVPVIIYNSDVYLDHQGYRYIYQQLSTYDPVMERMVKEYESGNTLIYGYTDSTYTTSNVVMSYVSNGNNFNTYENGDLQGWSQYTGREEVRPSIELTTDPVIDITKPLVDLSRIKQLEGYLKVQFASRNNSYVCNTGFIDNKAFIGSIARGDKFVFRYRGGATDIPESGKEVDRGSITRLQGNEINALVAFYTREYSTDLKAYVNTINTNGTILSFRGQGEKFNNKITEGYLEDNKYWINGVVQEPSTQYIYVSNEIEYIWDAQESAYIELTTDNEKFLDYYYLVTSARQAVSTDVLNDINTHIGIFISTINSDKWYYLQDIQLTRYYEDANGNPLMIGNIPTAIALDTNYYYIAPKIGTAANKIRTYASLDILAENMGVDPTTIKPIYNGGSIPFFETTNKPFYVHQQNFQELMEQFHVRGYSLDKILSIEASKSNCFNILQLIAETFECWVDLQVDHNEDGSLYLDALGKPTKLIYLRGYSGKDNDAGFKYGININSITREINSNEIVTKLIVEPVNSEYTDSGVVTIQNASANVSGESYIFNFDYYFNHDLIANVDACKNDMYQFDTDIREFNVVLDELNKEKINLEAGLTQLSARRNVYITLIETAQEKLTQSLEDFETAAGYTYETYQSITEEEQADLLEIDTVADIVGEIYTDSIVINNYSGITTNTDTEYLRLKKQLEGIKEHTIKVSRFQNTEDSQWHVKVELDDYIVPFSFTLGGTTYETTLNDKVFDIETTQVVLDNFIYNANTEDGYSLRDSSDNAITQVTATENEAQYIRLVPNSEVDGVLDRIEEKIQQKKIRIKDFYNKYSRFILEGTWSSQDYLSDDLYYLDALQVSNTSAHPQVTYTIDVAEISGLEGYEGYQFDTGDITYIEDTEFFGWKMQNGLRTPVKEEVIVSEIEWYLDNPSSNKITIQNYKTKFEDLFQRIQATVQTVQYNEATYVKTNRIVNPDGTLNQQMLLNSLNSISGLPQVLTTDGSIIIDGNSIFIRNLTNASDVVKLSSEGISISGDGGLTWSTAVSGRGISVENLFAGSINTDKITIGGANSPSFRWDSNGLSAFKETGATSSDEEGVYDFSKFVRFDQYGIYGIDLANSNGTSDFVPEDLEDVEENAHFALTWHGFFIRNNYEGGGRVEITSDNDFRVLNTVNDELNEKIKIGALEWEDENGQITTNPQQGVGAPTLYGIRIKNDDGAEVFKTGDDGNLYIEGTINATGGNFSDLVTVGKNSDDITDYIIIDGINSSISSANYNYTAGGSGWIINKDGDAVFNNITARGAIKTAVFEYAEIQAVGGVFLFRPSSTIKTAELNGNDLVLTVEKPKLFTTGEWCKVSNYTTNGNDPDIDDIANNGGLSHVYKISVNTNTDPVEITLINGKTLTDILGSSYALKLTGGALVDMGRDNTNEQFYSNGIYNYGIGINSSDNSVNLPSRAISLFETEIHPTDSIKVTYDYKAVLGTLPELNKVDQLYDDYLEGTQGIFTDNIYFGNQQNYITFYTDKESNPQKHLKIESANLQLNDNGAYINGEIIAHSGIVGGFAIDDSKLWSKVSYFKTYNSGREFLYETAGHFEIVNQPQDKYSFKYYIANPDPNGVDTYIPFLDYVEANHYRLNRTVYQYNDIDDDYYIYTGSLDFYTTGQGSDEELTASSCNLLNTLYEAIEYEPFNYEIYPFYSNNLILPYTTGIYFSSDEVIYDTDMNGELISDYFLTNDYTVAIRDNSSEPITGTSYYYYDEIDQEYKLFTEPVTNPVDQHLYLKSTKRYYTYDGTDYNLVLNVDINAIPKNIGWYELRTQAPTTQEHYSIIAGGPITYMRPTAEENQKQINIQHMAPTWYFRSDGAARFGSMSLSPDGRLDVPSLATITVDLGVMEQGIIKHDTVGQANGLWISTEDIDPFKHIIGPNGNEAEVAAANDGVSIADSPYFWDWRLIMGQNFGVTSEGYMYSNGASVKDLRLLLNPTDDSLEGHADARFVNDLTALGFPIFDITPGRDRNFVYLKIKDLLELNAVAKPYIMELPGQEQSAIVDGWTGTRGNYRYTLSMPSMREYYNVIVSPHEDYLQPYRIAKIRCIEQSNGGLLFKCRTIPEGTDRYLLTTDTTINPQKTYYIQDGNTYVITTFGPDYYGLYVKVITYELTSDDTPVEGHTYYAYNSETGEYEEVIDPDPESNPILEEWCEKVITYTLTSDTEFVEGETYYEYNELEDDYDEVEQLITNPSEEEVWEKDLAIKIQILIIT